MKKIKVLQLHPNYNIKKVDISDLGEQIFKALPSDRYTTITGFFLGEPSEGGAVSCADESVYFRMKESQLKGLRLFALWKLYKYIKQEKVDVVICNRYKPINMMLTLSRFLDVKLCIGIVHAFGDYNRRYRCKQVKKRANSKWRFVSVSPAVKDYLLGLNAGFSGKTVSITNAIDTAKADDVIVDKASARNELRLDQSIKVIGAIGRLVKLKGHANLINAFSKVADAHPDTHLVILGDGPERNNLQQLIESLKLQDRVHLMGFVPDAIRLIKAFDIFVMPSFKEGLGLALLEGMSGKLPVIASDVPAMLPLIEGAGGLSVPPGDEASLAAALKQYLLMTDEQLEAKGIEAYDYLVSNHDIDEFRRQYRTLIEEGLAK